MIPKQNNENDIFDILWAIEAPETLTQSLEKDSVVNETTKKPTPNVVTPIVEIAETKPVSEEKIQEPVIITEKITEHYDVEETQEADNWGQSVQEEAHISVQQTTEQNKEKNKSIARLLSASIFGAKYLVTSVFIFGALLLSTNYAAYTNIAKSYLFEDQIALESQTLLNWVDASYIEKEEEIVVEKKTKQEREEEIKKAEKETENIQNQFSIKKLVDKLDKEDINLDIAIVPYENRIIIPKIGKNIPLIDIEETKVEWKDQLDNIFMKELEQGIVRYPGSAIPWEKWNSFIFGHSSNFPWIAGDYNDVFSRLGQVEVWDIVYSYYGQKKYKYQIKEKKVISPTDVSILKRDKNKSELTLMTCWPIGTTLNRLILVWEIIEE